MYGIQSSSRIITYSSFSKNQEIALLTESLHPKFILFFLYTTSQCQSNFLKIFSTLIHKSLSFFELSLGPSWLTYNLLGFIILSLSIKTFVSSKYGKLNGKERLL